MLDVCVYPYSSDIFIFVYSFSADETNLIIFYSYTNIYIGYGNYNNLTIYCNLTYIYIFYTLYILV